MDLCFSYKQLGYEANTVVVGSMCAQMSKHSIFWAISDEVNFDPEIAVPSQTTPSVSSTTLSLKLPLIAECPALSPVKSSTRFNCSLWARLKCVQITPPWRMRTQWPLRSLNRKYAQKCLLLPDLTQNVWIHFPVSFIVTKNLVLPPPPKEAKKLARSSWETVDVRCVSMSIPQKSVL